MKLYIYDINLNLVVIVDDVARFEFGILPEYYLSQGCIISRSKFEVID